MGLPRAGLLRRRDGRHGARARARADARRGRVGPRRARGALGRRRGRAAAARPRHAARGRGVRPDRGGARRAGGAARLRGGGERPGRPRRGDARRRRAVRGAGRAACRLPRRLAARAAHARDARADRRGAHRDDAARGAAREHRARRPLRHGRGPRGARRRAPRRRRARRARRRAADARAPRAAASEPHRHAPQRLREPGGRGRPAAARRRRGPRRARRRGARRRARDPAPMTARPPNVLLVMVDQLAASWLPAYGHGVVQAPSLTALARAGTVFDAAYCAAPLCAPSRASLLTGRLPSRTCVYDNAAEMRASVPTFTHALRAAGYATALAGKMHFVGPDQQHGFEERLTPDVYPAGLDWTPDWRAPVGERLPWYHTMESVVSPGVSAASMQVDYDDEVCFHAVRAVFDHARGHAGEPFFLVASFTSPHDPWELPARYGDRYDPADIELPAVPAIPFDEADPHSRRLREMYGVDEAALSDEQIRHARHAYYAAISYVDERIGRVLGALRDAGLEEETLVVFTADHGEMLGERGLWYKMAFFEDSARVPLVVRGPAGHLRAGARGAAPVSLLDLAPTLLALCGPAAAEALADLDGTSLVPLLRGIGGREAPVVAEYLAEGVVAPAVMVRSGALKYVRCPGDPDQLYDLASDPREVRDLAAAGDGRPDALRAEADRRWDLAAIERDVLDSQRERRLVVAALDRGRYAAWDFEPRVDGAMRYVRSKADLYELQRRSRLDAPG